MSDRTYLSRQKEFWNVATLDEARFDRVDTRTDRTEESWVALADAEIRHVFDGAVIPEHATILELGCGVGRLLVRTRQRVPESVRIIGVDISESMVKFATEATAGMTNISLHITDGASLSMVATNSVAFAYSLHVFIHMNDGAMVRSYLQELSRVLVRGGRLRFNTRYLDVWRSFGWSPGGVWARLALLTGIRRSGGDWRTGDPTDFNGLRWRANDLRRELEQAGFRVETIGPKYEADELWCDVVKL